MILSLLLAALTWQQIELDQKLTLITPIVLSEKLTLPEGTTVKVNDIVGLDEIGVVVFEMQVTPCTSELGNEVSDIIMINEIYGAKLYQDCRLDVFLERRDLGRKSLFATE